jgi:hypothetical protein
MQKEEKNRQMSRLWGAEVPSKEHIPPQSAMLKFEK